MPEEANQLTLNLKIIPLDEHTVECWMKSIRNITEENEMLREKVSSLEQSLEENMKESNKKTSALRRKSIRRK